MLLNMKKYFVVSDIHGFYQELIDALKSAQYDKNNNEHILIVLGDIFDRGDNPWEVYQFLKSIPEDKLILIRGNHEQLLLDLVKQRCPCQADFSNGTYKTLVMLSEDPSIAEYNWILQHKEEYKDFKELYKHAHKIYEKAKERLYNNKKLNEILDWIESDRWRYFYEIGKYIFVHSFIPLQIIDKAFGTVRYNPNWRTSSSEDDLKESTWGCPYKLFKAGLFDEEIKKGKILVCGHWHSSDFYNHLIYSNQREKWLDIRSSNPIFKSEQYPNLIGIDACTALTHQINVLIINENEME